MRRRFLHSLITLLAWCIAAGLASGVFFGEKMWAQAPSIIGSSPRNGAEGLIRNAFVSCKLNLPTAGIGVDSTTLKTGVRLYPKDKPNQPVPVQLLLSNPLKNLTVEPVVVLEPFTTYIFEITADLKDQLGRSFLPYSTTFTTGSLDLSMSMNPTVTAAPSAPTKPATADPFGPKTTPPAPKPEAPIVAIAPDIPKETLPAIAPVAALPPEPEPLPMAPAAVAAATVPDPPVPVFAPDPIVESEPEPIVSEPEIMEEEAPEMAASPGGLKQNWPQDIDSTVREPIRHPEPEIVSIDSLPLEPASAIRPSFAAQFIGGKLQEAKADSLVAVPKPEPVVPALSPPVASAPLPQPAAPAPEPTPPKPEPKPTPPQPKPVVAVAPPKPKPEPEPEPELPPMTNPELEAYESLVDDLDDLGDDPVVASPAPKPKEEAPRWVTSYPRQGTQESDTLSPPRLNAGGLEVEPGESTVTIKWITTEEYRQGFFRVERSADGKKFAPVKIVTSPGNSDTLRLYTVEDHQPNPGTNYYRVLMVNRLKERKYLDPVPTTFNGRQPVSFPQRNVLRDGSVKVDFDLAQSGAAQMMLKARNNRIIKRISGNIPEGKNRQEISLKGVPPGVYMLGIKAEGKIFTHIIQVLY